MTEFALPNYAELDLALSKTALKLHASQVHGLITGVLCGPVINEAWEDLVTGGKETKLAHELLQSLYETSKKQLEDFLFEFQLMLPPDSEELPKRAEAMSLWVQGFLTGLKLVDINIVGRKPGDATEAINDMIEIAKMNYEDVVASEEDEEAYAELVEYVRMGAILIYQDLHGGKTVEKKSKAH